MVCWWCLFYVLLFYIFVMKLSKTDYILWRECKKNAWMKWHRRDEYDAFGMSEFEQSLMEQGNGIEEVARTRWAGGYLIERRSPGAVALTQKLMAAHEPVIFQAAFETEHYFVAADVLAWNPVSGVYDLYEVKMSTTEKGRKREYDYDIGFQKMVIERAGARIGKTFLLKLNSEYVRHGALDVHALFQEDDKTETVTELGEVIAEESARAYAYVQSAAEPEGHCDCYAKGRGAHCTAFPLCNPGVPAYGIHDLNMKHMTNDAKSAFRKLLASGVLRIDDIEDVEGMTLRQKNQVRAHQSQAPILDMPAIEAELDSLVYPLYFLDYETYPSAIPAFDGYSPYQQIVFQYSLHIKTSPLGAVEHTEFIQMDGADPAKQLAASLKKDIGATGNVIVWNKTFENTRNKELAKHAPEYADFFQDLIARTYDLMDIVEKQHYVHPGFKGKASIKYVGPVLAPDVSYADLHIKGGTGAIEGYRQVTSGEVTAAAKDAKIADMLAYCKQDTYAMVRVWEEFMKLAGRDV